MNTLRYSIVDRIDQTYDIMSKNTCTALVVHDDELPVAFRTAFKAANDAKTSVCPRCFSATPATRFFVTCIEGCCSCDQCPLILGDDFWFKTKKGTNECYNASNRACQAASLPQPVPNKAYEMAKEVLEEVDTALKHGVSLIKENGYVTEGMERGEAAPKWVPVTPKEAMFKAKAEIASAVNKMKAEGKTSKEIEAFLCGDTVDVEEDDGGEEEPEEPTSKQSRKDPTAEQLERRERRKEETRKRSLEKKRRLEEYPALKDKCAKMEKTIRSARSQLLSEKDPDEVNALLGEESEEEEEDDNSIVGVSPVDSDGE